MTPVLLYEFRRDYRNEFMWAHDKLRCYTIHPDGTFRHEVVLQEVYISSDISDKRLESAIAHVCLSVKLSEDVKWFVYDCEKAEVLHDLGAEFISDVMSRVSVSVAASRSFTIN